MKWKERKSKPGFIEVHQLLPGPVLGVHLDLVGRVVEGQPVEVRNELDLPTAHHVEGSHAVLVLQLVKDFHCCMVGQV